jgi:hypothetical protein
MLPGRRSRVINISTDTRNTNDQLKTVATLWLVHAAAYDVMGLRTLLTPIVAGKKYLPLNPVAGMERNQ